MLKPGENPYSRDRFRHSHGVTMTYIIQSQGVATRQKVGLELTAILRFPAFLESEFEVVLDRNQVQPHSFGLSWSQDGNRAEPETGP